MSTCSMIPLVKGATENEDIILACTTKTVVALLDDDEMNYSYIPRAPLQSCF